MIAKISKGSGFGGVVRYVLDKDKAHTILTGAKQCFGEDASEIASGFQKIAKLGNSRIPVRHYSIAFAPGDGVDGIIDDDTKSEIVNRIMDEMGFGNCQYFAVAHDRDDPNHHEAHNHDHLHIVANAITPEGKRVPDSWEKAKRSPPVKKTELQTKINRSLEDLPDLKTWINRMEADGVNLRFKVTSRGCIQGISYVSDGKLTKGADAGMGWKSLADKFGNSPDDAKLALASNLKTQSLPVILRRQEQEQLVRTADLAVEKLDGKVQYKDKSVEIKFVAGVLTVNRLRPNKRILAATKSADGEWKSIGIPDIDKKKDLNILGSKSKSNDSTERKVGLITEGNPLQHLSQLTAQSVTIAEDISNSSETVLEQNPMIVQEQESIDLPVIEIPVIVETIEIESINPLPVVNEAPEMKSIDFPPITKPLKTKSKRTYSK